MVFLNNPAVGPAEERVVLRNVPWQTFEHLLVVLGDRRSVRLAYAGGDLELMSPLARHEFAKSFIGRLIETWASARNVPVAGRGSLTLRREDLQRGAEPDECYYIQNEQAVRGLQNIDLSRDPPPDLIVEVDITSQSTLRLGIYAALGIPEVWRFDGQTLTILRLCNGGYAPGSESLVLPGFPTALILPMVRMAETEGETAAVRQFLAGLS
jgi:Uma2 family endonuclease